MSDVVTSPDLRRSSWPRRRLHPTLKLASCFWFFVVPALVATAGCYLASSSPAPDDAGAIEAWLQDQVVLVWLAAFVATTGMLRYWKHSLPPKSVWKSSRLSPVSRGWRELAYAAAWIAGATGFALALRAFVAEPAKVRSISMLPTMTPGDLLLVGKWDRRTASVRRSTLPERGRAIFLLPPDPAVKELEPALFKRVIGLPGDVLSVERGGPVINGWRVPRCPVGAVSFDLPSMEASTGGGLAVEWLGDETYLTLLDGVPHAEPQGPYTVKPGEVWVLGDNRNRSSDSRNWFHGKGGGVPLQNVEGYPTWSLLSTLGETKVRVARMGVPTLPSNAHHLSGALERCLANKPARTSPPPPK